MGTARADHLLAEHAPALRNFLGARCRDNDPAAELMQAVAARLVVAAPRLRANGNPRGYVFRIATSVWHDHLRRQIVRRRAVQALAQGEPTHASAADEALLARELRTAVRRAVAALPPPQREGVELRHRGGGAVRGGAERVGRPPRPLVTAKRARVAKNAAGLVGE